MAAIRTLEKFTPLHAEYASPPSRPGLRITIDTDHLHVSYGTPGQIMRFSSVMPEDYDLLGVDVTLIWAALTATSGTVYWSQRFQKLPAGHNILSKTSDDALWGTQLSSLVSVSGAGILTYTTTRFTHAQINNIQRGEAYRFQVSWSAGSALGRIMLFRAYIATTGL